MGDMLEKKKKLRQRKIWRRESYGNKLTDNKRHKEGARDIQLERRREIAINTDKQREKKEREKKGERKSFGRERERERSREGVRDRESKRFQKRYT